MKKFQYGWVVFGLLATAGAAQSEEFTGQYLATGNLSTQSRLMPSLNSRLTANYAPPALTGNFDFRLERYTENSYHTVDGNMTRERKFEAQVNFNFPLTEHFVSISFFTLGNGAVACAITGNVFYVYKFFIHCELMPSNFINLFDLLDKGFFAKDAIPSLSLNRVLPSQINLMFEYLNNPLEDTLID